MKRQHGDLNGIRMHWDEAGQGPPVVMVHGLATSPSLWRHVAPRINGTRCLAWQMVGYGSAIAQGERRDLSMTCQAAYLLDWLRMLNIERAVLVGHDLGGGVVQIAAKQRPALCAGLVLVNSIGYDAWPAPAAIFARRFGMLARCLPKRAFKLAFRRFLHRTHATRAQAAEAFTMHWPHYEEYGTRAFVWQARHLHLRDTRGAIAALQRLRAPMRVVWGAGDRVLPVRYGFRFARDLDAPFQYIFNGRHFTPEDHPEVVAETINEVVAQFCEREYPQYLEPERRYG